jgi:hypothetical protein
MGSRAAAPPGESIVPFASDVTNEIVWTHSRSMMRLNSRVPVAIEWTQAGEQQRAQGYTLDVSPKGCLAIVPKGVDVGQDLQVINLINNQACKAVLIWRGHESRTGWELGLELQDPPADFWNIEF